MMMIRTWTAFQEVELKLTIIGGEEGGQASVTETARVGQIPCVCLNKIYNIWICHIAMLQYKNIEVIWIYNIRVGLKLVSTRFTTSDVIIIQCPYLNKIYIICFSKHLQPLSPPNHFPIAYQFKNSKCIFISYSYSLINCVNLDFI